MKSFLTLVCSFSLFLPTTSYALFQKIYSGYKNSNRLNHIKVDKEIIESDFKLGELKYNWALSLTGAHSNSNLATISSFQTNQTISDSATFELSKSSYKYGTFSVSHSQISYDLSNWSASSLSSYSDDQLFEGKNKLSYSYEILNNSGPVDWEILNSENKLNQLGHKLNFEKDHFDFYSAYINAKIRIILDGLYKEFEARAKKRVSLIKRRVRDGLSRDVDLNQAKLSLLTQQETIIRNTGVLRESVSIIEDIIGIKIPEKDYGLVQWTFKSQTDLISNWKNDKSLELEQLKAANELTDLNLVKVDEQINHSLNLALSYTRNSVNAKSGEAVSDSISEGKSEEKVLSLTYSFPLGFDKKDTMKSKILLQKNKNELGVKNLSGQIKVQTETLRENISRYEKAITLLDSKVAIAKQVVRQNQSLYLKGRISFEERLRAEETLINAQISQMNMYLLYEQSVAKLAYMTGNIITFLDTYRD